MQATPPVKHQANLQPRHRRSLSNTFFLSAENRTYNFTHTDGYDPNFLTSSTDQGSTWTYGGHLLRDPASSNSGRPYLKYASNGVDKIYFISTKVIRTDTTTRSMPAISATEMNIVPMAHWSDRRERPPQPRHRQRPSPLLPRRIHQSMVKCAAHYWTTHLHVDSNGNPYAAFTSHREQQQHRSSLSTSRWDGTQWNVHQSPRRAAISTQRERLHRPGQALDPDDPNTLYISTKIHPASGTTMSHYEIFKGVTTNGGTDWN